MATKPEEGLTDTGRLLFGAGFVFGVMVTLLLLAVVVAVVAVEDSGRLLDSTALVVAAAGVLFATIVGSGLYLLAFPENRTQIPIDPESFGLDEEE